MKTNNCPWERIVVHGNNLFPQTSNCPCERITVGGDKYSFVGTFAGYIQRCRDNSRVANKNRHEIPHCTLFKAACRDWHINCCVAWCELAHWDHSNPWSHGGMNVYIITSVYALVHIEHGAHMINYFKLSLHPVVIHNNGCTKYIRCFILADTMFTWKSNGLYQLCVIAILHKKYQRCIFMLGHIYSYI